MAKEQQPRETTEAIQRIYCETVTGSRIEASDGTVIVDGFVQQAGPRALISADRRFLGLRPERKRVD